MPSRFGRKGLTLFGSSQESTRSRLASNSLNRLRSVKALKFYRHRREVLLYSYLGLTSLETANAINRSLSTVHAHRDSVRRKVGCKLSAVALSRLIYAHRAVEEMNYLEPRVGVGKHYNL